MYARTAHNFERIITFWTKLHCWFKLQNIVYNILFFRQKIVKIFIESLGIVKNLKKYYNSVPVLVSNSLLVTKVLHNRQKGANMPWKHPRLDRNGRKRTIMGRSTQSAVTDHQRPRRWAVYSGWRTTTIDFNRLKKQQ